MDRLQKHRLLEFTFDHAPDAIYWVDSKGEVKYANRAACHMLGYSRKELVGKKVPELNPEYSIRDFKKHFIELVQKGSEQLDSVQITKYGKELPVFIYSKVIDIDGKNISCTYISQLRKKNLSATQDYDLQEKLLNLFNHSRDAIFIGDPDKNRILNVNKKACEVLEYSKEELLQAQLTEIIPNQRNTFIAFFNKIKKQKGASTDKLVFRSKYGKIIKAELSASIFSMDGKSGILGILHLISKEDQFEKLIGQVTEAAIIHPERDIISSFVSQAAKVLQIRYAGVSKLKPDSGTEVSLLTFWDNDHFRETFDYNIMGSPCQHVVDGDFRSYPRDVTNLFPNSELFEHFQPESYMAVPISDRHKRPIGHFFLCDTIPLERKSWIENLLRLGALRMRLEIERLRAEERAQEAKLNLKKKVRERTIELTRTNEKLEKAIKEVEELKDKLYAENIYLKEEIKLDYGFGDIISEDKAFVKVLNAVKQVAQTDSTVLILGETGTGKEVFTRNIHSLSKRNDKPLVKLNCAALPATLIESELFGHERGAFTGAETQRKGRFELADEGTLFLDEIGEIPLELQPKLLRALQEGEFERLGGTKTIKVNVRVIAATNRDLEKAVRQKEFRADLFYRLNVFPIEVPPLRARRKDISLLAKFFARKYNKKLGKNVTKVPQAVLNQLDNYTWPGNVRELENIIERAVIISTGENLQLGDWLKGELDRRQVKFKPLNEMEKDYILEVLGHTEWRVSGKNGAAQILNVKPTTLEARMKKLGIQRKITF